MPGVLAGHLSTLVCPWLPQPNLPTSPPDMPCHIIPWPASLGNPPPAVRPSVSLGALLVVPIFVHTLQCKIPPGCIDIFLRLSLPKVLFPIPGCLLSLYPRLRRAFASRSSASLKSSDEGQPMVGQFFVGLKFQSASHPPLHMPPSHQMDF